MRGECPTYHHRRRGVVSEDNLAVVRRAFEVAQVDVLVLRRIVRVVKIYGSAHRSRSSVTKATASDLLVLTFLDVLCQTNRDRQRGIVFTVGSAKKIVNGGEGNVPPGATIRCRRQCRTPSARQPGTSCFLRDKFTGRIRHTSSGTHSNW